MEKHSEILKITPGCTDHNGMLGYYETFRAFMDMAAIHAELLGVGFEAMFKRRLFWLTVKTRVDFSRRPKMREEAELLTWPEAPGRLRANRSYEARVDGELCIRGRTEWAVIDTDTNRLVPMKGIFSDELIFDIPAAIDEPFAQIPDEFTPDEQYSDYTVRSIDIDVGGHMNNAAYVRTLIGSLSIKELNAIDPKSITVIFRAPCHEGDLLKLYRHDTETYSDFKMMREDETVLLCRMEKTISN